jgi:hypothetical protein
MSRVESLNDPFDFIPSIGNTDASEIAKYVDARPWLFRGKPRAGTVAGVKAQWDKIKGDPRRGLQPILKNTRILCLSDRDDGILLWSHYASRHRGFVVGYRTDELRKPPCSLFFEPVHYAGARPYFSPADFVGDGDTVYENYKRLFFYKSEEWKYESEWRAALLASRLKDPNYADFLPSAVECVIFGSEMDGKMESLIRQACERGGISSTVKFKRASLSTSSFQIVISSLEEEKGLPGKVSE